MSSEKKPLSSGDCGDGVPSKRPKRKGDDKYSEKEEPLVERIRKCDSYKDRFRLVREERASNIVDALKELNALWPTYKKEDREKVNKKFVEKRLRRWIETEYYDELPQTHRDNIKGRTERPNTVCVLSLEATCEEGVTDFPHEIIFIKLTFFDTESGEEIDSLQYFCLPTENPILSDHCKHITKIKQEDVDKGLPFAEVAERMEKTLAEMKQLSEGKLLVVSKNKLAVKNFLQWQYEHIQRPVPPIFERFLSLNNNNFDSMDMKDWLRITKREDETTELFKQMWKRGLILEGKVSLGNLDHTKRRLYPFFGVTSSGTAVTSLFSLDVFLMT
eukprot:m.62775 g.62775  ORF g.62775 m.62775 type:complete len:331 (+) comp11415_c1_seq3:32-1024(+)